MADEMDDTHHVELERLRVRVAELEQLESENLQIQQTLFEQKAILELIANGVDLREVLTGLLQRVEVATPGIRCSILLLDRKGTHLRLGAAPSLPAEFNRAIDNLEVGPENGCCGAAVYFNRLIVIANTATSSLCAGFTHYIEKFHLGACWSSPIYGKDNKIIGTFATYYEAPTVPSDDELNRIERVTHLAAIAIERKQAEDALRQSEEKYRCLIEAIPQLVWTTEARGAANFVNQHWLDFTGQTLEQFSNTGWLDVVHPEDRPATYETWTKAVNSGQLYEVEYRLRRRNGIYRWFLARGVPVKNEQDQITGWMGTCTDINDQKELDDLKNLFVSIASHELKTPLTVISGYTQNLLRTLTQQGEQSFDEKLVHKFDRSLSRIAVQTDNSLALINQLLDFSRMQSNKLEVNCQENTNLVELVQQVVEQQAHLVTDHKLQTQINLDKAIGNYDKSRLEQVLSNLINNAVKYSPAQTTITVGMAQQEADVVVWVRDYGCGISLENQAHIFDSFYRERTNQNYSVEGLGLGLYISHEIIEQHNGRMWVESQPNQGSTFYFALPVTVPAFVS